MKLFKMRVKKKIFLIFFLFFFFFSSVFAEDIFFKGDLNVELNNNVYVAGDNISAEIMIYNMENFPIGDLNLIVQILKGCQSSTYPSQFSDCDNVFHEEIIRDIKLPPLFWRKVYFNYTLPEDLSSGDYRIDFFLETGRTHILGIPSIFLPGKEIFFTVEGPGDYPDIKILRTKTNIKNETGPIGVGVFNEEKVNLEVFLESKKEKNVDIYLSICEWKDTPCEEEIFNVKKSQKVSVGEQKVNIDFYSPKRPGVYSISIFVKENDRVLSVYRSRLIVYGDDARIRKLYPDKTYYKKENALITLFSSGSPDHYNNPEVKDALVSIEIKNLDNGKEYKKEFLRSYPSSFSTFKDEAVFFIEEEMKSFEICGKILDKNTNDIYDSYCYIIDSKNFVTEKEVRLENKKYTNGFFEGELCVYDKNSNFLLDGKFVLILFKNNSIIEREEIVIEKCKKISYNLKMGEVYTLIVNSEDEGKQFSFDLFYKENTLKKSLYDVKILLITLILFIIFLILYFLIKKKKQAIQ